MQRRSRNPRRIQAPRAPVPRVSRPAAPQRPAIHRKVLPGRGR